MAGDKNPNNSQGGSGVGTWIFRGILVGFGAAIGGPLGAVAAAAATGALGGDGDGGDMDAGMFG